MALTIATGFVVDDAIVVIENISRYIEKGEKPLAAALKGAGADRLHHHLADLLADRGADPAAVHGRRGRAAVPRVRRDAGGGHSDLGGGVADPDADDVRAHAERRIAAQAEPLLPRLRGACLDKVIAGYGRWLTRVLRHPWLTLAVALGTLALTVLLWMFIPKGFFPMQDNGIIQGTLQAPQSVSFANMAQRQQHVAEIVMKDPAVESLTSFVGVDGTNPALNSARLQINLKPLDERDDRVNAGSAAAPAAGDRPPCPAWSCTCSRCRI